MALIGGRWSGAGALPGLASAFLLALACGWFAAPAARAADSVAAGNAPTRVAAGERARASTGRGARLRRADADHDGYLSRAEVQHALPRLAMHFDAIDANRDGRLSAQEIRGFGRAKGMARAAGARQQGGAIRQSDAAFIAADVDGDGLLSRAEAAAALPRVASKFERMDANGDGQLSAGEFRAWLARRKAGRTAKT